MARLAIIPIAWILLAGQAASASPLDYTRAILEQAHEVVASNGTHNEKLATLAILFGNFLDSDTMGQEALGSHWSSFTPVQQSEFLALFRNLLEQTYVERLLLFDNPKFVYAGQRNVGNEAIVDTKIITPRDQFDIQYTLLQKGDSWRVTAIRVEGVRLTGNLASQLNDLLARMTPDDLLVLMRRKYGRPSGSPQT